jgi:hypothetical protein
MSLTKGTKVTLADKLAHAGTIERRVAINRTTFFVKRSARLIARLQLIVYCWRFAQRVDGRVVAIWPPLTEFYRRIDGAEYSPSLIFDLEVFYGGGGAESLVFLEGRIPTPKMSRSVRDREFADQIPNTFDAENFRRNALTFHELLPITYSFKDEPKDIDYFRRSLRKTYEALPHHPLIIHVLNDSRRRIAAESYVGLHVRRGDIIDLLRNELPRLEGGLVSEAQLASVLRAYLGRTTLYESYYGPVEDAIAEGRKVVFFSDSPETFDHFAAKFGGRHFVNAARLVKPRHAIQKAFVDFNLLVGASRIISTGGSIYASFAAMLGGGRLINVAGTVSLERMENYLYEQCLAGIDIGASSRQRIRAGMERQYAEVIRARAANTDLPPLPLK